LEASRNPFAKVVMAQLRTLETRNNKVQRKVWKFSLVRQLHEEGYNRQEIQDLFRFVNWIMQLPKPLEIEFWQEVLAYEEARKMTYMTNLERALVEQKLQEVRSEERQEIALNLLRKNYPLEEIAEVTFLSIEELQSLRNTLASNS
jgi:SOS response regulatory protein OraA/RecX